MPYALWRQWRYLLILVLVGLLVLSILGAMAAGRSASSSATAAEGWPTLTLTEQVDGLTNPVHLTHAADGSGRLFVVEQAGTIRIIKDGSMLSEPFLDITERVVSGGEQGLLSVAFPPEYANKGYFYVNYTRQGKGDTQGDTIISRFFLTEDADIADASSEQRIMLIDQPYDTHNGGKLTFGPDGYLYIGMGDGGSVGDPDNYAQAPAELLGKLLRIDVESGPVVPPDTAANTVYLPVITDTSGSRQEDRGNYLIPPTNPYTSTAGYRPEIWALGLRNPWRFSFDRATGDMYIGDVGQNAYEEIDFQPAQSSGGENYGWSCKEGTHDYPPTVVENCESLNLVPPIFEYGRSTGGRSVTGGFVYRGSEYTDMQGIYFFGDYNGGIIWGLRPANGDWENELLLQSGFLISSFGEDEAGNLYVLDYLGGRVLKLNSTTP
jgi:glucose/arabinose dehydrogenase